MMDPPRILLVDDEANLLSGLSRVLGLDYSVTSALSGAQALDILAEGPPFAAIISDMQMPEMKGSDLLRIVRERYPETIRMLLTGHASLQAAMEAVNEADIFRFMVKPCPEETLNRAVTDAVEYHRALTERRHLFEETQRLNGELAREVERNEAILHAVLPPSVVSELKEYGEVQPRTFEDVVILFCDVSNFTAYCATHQAQEVFHKLSALFGAYEKLMPKFGMEKIKTIGDAFMATGNLLVKRSNAVAHATACGLAMIDKAKELDLGWDVRVSLRSGPVVAGILGKQNYQLDLWGDTVNVASRISTLAFNGQVLMLKEDWEKVMDQAEGKSLGHFSFKGRGTLEVYGVTQL